jgi:short-subunit dehydrogenase
MRLEAADVTLLINNAGTLSSFNVLRAPRANIEADFGVQVHGTLDVIKAFVPVLEHAPGGATIVNVLSPMAEQMGALRRQDPKAYERALASF